LHKVVVVAVAIVLFKYREVIYLVNLQTWDWVPAGMDKVEGGTCPLEML